MSVLVSAIYCYYLVGRSVFGKVTRLWAGWSWVRSKAEAIHLHSPNRPDWHWSTFSLTFSGYRGIFAQGQSDQGAKLCTLFYLTLRLGTSVTTPLLAPTPLRAFTPTTLPLPIYFMYINRHS